MKHVERTQPELDHLHIRLYQAVNLTIDHTWNSEDVCSPYWRFYVNSRAGASVVMADRTYPLAAHRIHFVPAWVRWTCHNTRPIDHLFAHFDLVGLPGVAVRTCFPGPITLPEDRELEAQCEALRPLVGKGSDRTQPQVTCMMKSAIFRALSSLFAHLGPEQRQRIAQHTASDNPVAAALSYIDEHLSDDLPNALLAKRCGFSVDHFVRLFRARLNQTPAQYVLERRLNRAAERLVFGNDSIDLIASECGFPDRFYFTRMFRRRMGLPPAAYRRTSHQQA
ncbi:MAG: helix-turn-helix transcriptional regulator [Planctomycetes bacterium]|nr:helix-turn-helix transcriptional regulator [Planctomycetota bacterium]